MYVDSKDTQVNNALTEEDYSRAMNFIGQQLLSSLTQTLEKLSPSLRNRAVVSQGLAAFLANVIHKQFPNDFEICEQMLAEFSKNTDIQLKQIFQQSALAR
ncbi:MAG: hypothetical protein H0U70_04785 [Tatlockia sp.]|nr:hypothetical protein [Tatlockia sp.]